MNNKPIAYCTDNRRWAVYPGNNDVLLRFTLIDASCNEIWDYEICENPAGAGPHYDGFRYIGPVPREVVPIILNSYGFDDQPA